MFCTSGPNLVIIAWAGDKLSSGQTDDWRTHTHTYTHTHRQTQATTIPEGHNWPRVKTIPSFVPVFALLTWHHLHDIFYSNTVYTFVILIYDYEWDWDVNHNRKWQLTDGDLNNLVADATKSFTKSTITVKRNKYRKYKNVPIDLSII